MPVTLADAASLALVPGFCDIPVHRAWHLSSPAKPWRKSPLAKIRGVFASLPDDGSLLAGIPGDGIEPPTLPLVQLSQAPNPACSWSRPPPIRDGSNATAR